MIKVTYCDLDNKYRIISQELKTDNFPDGTLLLKTNNMNFNESIKIEWYYENDAELFTIICLAKKCMYKKTLFMPYCPHARQDRIKNTEDTFTLKYFAEVINSLGFDEVRILDPHSNVCTALIDRVCAITPLHYILKAINKIKDPNLVLFFPDEGSIKRYSDMFELPYAFGVKKRDWKTGQIQGLDVIDNGIDLKDKTILIIDDICSRGGTFYHSAKTLKELGVGDIYLWVTHCENTILEGEILTSGLIEKVFTTNSLFTKEHEKVEVLEYDK
jgi:ribose-phosphate pyrophosphokinase